VHSLLLLAAVLTLDGGAIRVSGFDAAHASSSDFSQILRVYTEPHSVDQPPLLGRYSVESGDLVFHPRFAWQPGLRYRAVFGAPGESPIEKVFEIPAVAHQANTVVTEVFPTAPVLPANTLKFYIYFFRAHVARRRLRSHSFA